MPPQVKIIRVENWNYIEAGGRAVNGFRVYFEMPEFGETQFVQVPRNDPNTVQTAIQQAYNNRKSLDKLTF